jgi:hypothetical protein
VRLTDVILRVMEDPEWSMRTHAERRYWANQIRLAIEQATRVETR